jgi:hypothetical protein
LQPRLTRPSTPKDGPPAIPLELTRTLPNLSPKHHHYPLPKIAGTLLPPDHLLQRLHHGVDRGIGSPFA